jgi:alkanesulfonate monooxygenase SsuD/methylene tetrahydromethanopterin reductase-like flavin-dependent oxidoreductase (luciferase family)
LFFFGRLRKALFMVKGHLATLDEDVTVDAIKRALIIAGSPRRVLDQLVALREETGHFGTLLMGGHDWDQPQLWRRSMELLATEVMSKFARHAAAIRPR